MELRLGSHVFSISDFVIYVVDAEEAARIAGIAEIDADPELVARTRLRHPGLPLAVAAPTPVVARACVEAGADLLVGDRLAEVAAATGAGLVCSDPDGAEAAGVRADGVLIEATSVSRAQELAAAARPVFATFGVAAPEGGGAYPVADRTHPSPGPPPSPSPGPSPGPPPGRLPGHSPGRLPGPSPTVVSTVTDPGLLAAVCIHAWVGTRVFRVPTREAAPIRQALDMVASIRGTRPPTVSRRGLV